MNTKSWGPYAWKFLHYVTFNYPEKPTEDDKESYADLFWNLTKTLPCKLCKESYFKFISEDPVDNHLHSRDTLVKWLYNLHSKVNDKLVSQGNRTTKSPAYSVFLEEYESKRAVCCKDGQCTIDCKTGKGTPT